MSTDSPINFPFSANRLHTNPAANLMGTLPPAHQTEAVRHKRHELVFLTLIRHCSYLIKHPPWTSCHPTGSHIASILTQPGRVSYLRHLPPALWHMQAHPKSHPRRRQRNRACHLMVQSRCGNESDLIQRISCESFLMFFSLSDHLQISPMPLLQ